MGLAVRRKRSMESAARGHTTAPLVVHEMEPMEDHPGLGPLLRKKRAARVVVVKSKPTKTKVKVEVKVDGET